MLLLHYHTLYRANTVHLVLLSHIFQNISVTDNLSFMVGDQYVYERFHYHLYVRVPCQNVPTKLPNAPVDIFENMSVSRQIPWLHRSQSMLWNDTPNHSVGVLAIVNSCSLRHLHLSLYPPLIAVICQALGRLTSVGQICSYISRDYLPSLVHLLLKIFFKQPPKCNRERPFIYIKIESCTGPLCKVFSETTQRCASVRWKFKVPCETRKIAHINNIWGKPTV